MIKKVVATFNCLLKNHNIGIVTHIEINEDRRVNYTRVYPDRREHDSSTMVEFDKMFNVTLGSLLTQEEISKFTS